MTWTDLDQQRLKLCIAAAAIIISMWYAIGYRPRRDEARSLALRQETLVKERDQLRKALSQEGDRVQQPSPRPARIAPAVAAALPPEARLNYFLRTISTPANDLDLSYFTVTPQPPVPGPGYEELPFTISLVGRYASLADFLYELEYRHDFIVRNLTLNPSNGGLQADFQLAALLPSEGAAPDSSKPAADPGRPTSLELARDPFLRPPAKIAVDPQGRSYFLNVPPGLTLSGFMESAGRTVAIINHEPYGIGESIDHKTITRINDRGVELSDKVRSYFLEMEQPSTLGTPQETQRP